MFSLGGAYEEPDPQYLLTREDRQYSFKQDSSLYEYLVKKDPGAIKNLGFYRFNYILTVLFRIIKREKLFDRRRRQFVVCDRDLQKALGRTWFSVNSIVSIVRPQLDLHVKAHNTGEKIYNISYRVEADAIAALLDWK